MADTMEFENQRSDEEIVIVSRKHPWVLAKAGLVLLAIFLLVIISFIQFGASKPSAAILVIALITAIIYSSSRWFIYANDVFILTNQRLISINQKGIFNRRVSEAELENILNISYETKGLVQSLLNFGDIVVDTSGSDQNYIVLKDVTNPHFIHEKMVSLQKNMKSRGLSAND